MLRLHLLLFIAVCASSILIERSIKLSQLQQTHGWIILGGTGISPGTIELKVQIQMFSQLYEPNGYQLQIGILTHGQLQIENNNHCTIRSRQLEIQAKLMKNRNELAYTALSLSKIQATYSEFMFVVLRDCSHTLIKQYFQRNAIINIAVNIENNQSNVSVQQSYCHWLIIINLIASTCMVHYLLKSLKSHDSGCLNKYILIILVSTAARILIQETKTVSHILSGSHYYILDCMEILAKGVNSSIFLFIFLNVSLGWTTKKEKQPLCQSLQWKIILVLIEIATSALSYAWIIDFSQQNWMKLFMDGTHSFLLLICITFVSFKLKTANTKQSTFYKRIIIVMTINILSNNFYHLFSKETYFINQITIQTALQLLDSLVNYIILKTFVGPSSAHFKICLRNKSFMQ